MHYLFTNDTEESFVVRILKEPHFQSGELSLYANVPVKCIRYTGTVHLCANNPCSNPAKYADRVIDYLVCYGNVPLLCVCFDEQELQSRNLFETYLHGMHYVSHNFLDVTQEAFDALFDRVKEALWFFTDYQLITADYSVETEAVDADMDTLRKKCLVGEHVLPRFFARDCGLFFQCVLSEQDSAELLPFTVSSMAQTVNNVLHWNTPLSDDALQLRQILDAPLEEFYGKRPVRLRALREFTGGIEGVSVKTYRDCLYLVLNMRKAIADPNIDWDRIQGTQINILIFLADVLRKDGLPVFELSLRRYYRAAAELTNSYYPIWLYETRVRPHLCNADEESFTVADAAEHAVLRHAPIADTHSWLTALTILMVWPICSPNAR